MGKGGPLAFLNKKGWHTGSMQNTEKVWKKEEEERQEKRKLEELKKHIQEEREHQLLTGLAEDAGHKEKSDKMDWMYQGGMMAKQEADARADEVLLGAKPLQLEEEKVISRAEAVSLLPTFYVEDTPQSANESWSRLHSDPLFAIKQQELAARKRIVANPVKMTAIKREVQQVKELKEQSKAERKAAKAAKKAAKKESKEKKHHKKRKSAEPSEDSGPEGDITVRVKPEPPPADLRLGTERRGDPHRRRSDDDAPRQRGGSEENGHGARRGDGHGGRNVHDGERRRDGHGGERGGGHRENGRHHEEYDRHDRHRSDRDWDPEPREHRERSVRVKEEPGLEAGGGGGHREKRPRHEDDSRRDRGERPRAGREDGDGGSRRHGHGGEDAVTDRPPARSDGASAHAPGTQYGLTYGPSGKPLREGDAAADTRRRLEEGARLKEQEERELAAKRNAPKQHRAGLMTEEERAARLAEMSGNAEVHDAARGSRLKNASHRDSAEEAAAAARLAAGGRDGSGFIEKTKRSLYGTSASADDAVNLETRVGSRKFYNDRGDPNRGAFQR